MNATSLISSLIVAILYCYTAFRSIAGGDSGELIAEACVGGVAHPVRLHLDLYHLFA